MALPRLLGALFPSGGFSDDMTRPLLALQGAIEAAIAPRAAANDKRGRYPTQSIAALKRCGFLGAVLPTALGGSGLSRRASLEAQLRLAVADPAVAQIYKVHDELVREILAICTPALAARLAHAIVAQDAIIGLAVAEAGARVDALLTTLAEPRADGGFVVTGRKIYTTGAAEADLIATWAFNAQAADAAVSPLAGMQLILIPPATKGITILRDWDALGQRATDSGTIQFDAVETDPLWNVTRVDRPPPPHASLGYQAGFAAILTGIGINALREAAAFVGTSSRAWPSAGVERAVDDPLVRRLTGELGADLLGAYMLTLAAGDLLDAYERGEIDRTDVAIPVYAAKSAAHRAALRTTSEIHALMGTRSATAAAGFDRHWRNARMLSLHDPIDWKHAEIGRHVLTGWEPPPGLYQ